jgi:hypothetical protein
MLCSQGHKLCKKFKYKNKYYMNISKTTIFSVGASLSVVPSAEQFSYFFVVH